MCALPRLCGAVNLFKQQGFQFNMRLKSVILGAAALVVLAPAASWAAVTISVTPSVAPNAFGSPSYAGYVANATGALHDGDTSRGNPGLPTYYQAQSNVSADQVIVTGF